MSRVEALASRSQAHRMQSSKQLPDCLVRIRNLYPQLTEKERVVADHVLARTDIVHRTITQVVRSSGASYGSVDRFCKKLGYSGFQDLKIHLAEDLAARRVQQQDLTVGYVQDCVRQASQDINNTVQLLSKTDLAKAADAVASARFVLVCGLSSSAGTAMGIGYRLTRYGITSSVAIDNHMQRHIAATLGPRDAAILLSFSGSTREIIATCRIAIAAKSSVIAMTNHSESPLSELAPIVLTTGIEGDPLGAEIASKVAVEFLITLLFDRVGQRIKNARKMLARTFEATADRQL